MPIGETGAGCAVAKPSPPPKPPNSTKPSRKRRPTQKKPRGRPIASALRAALEIWRAHDQHIYAGAKVLIASAGSKPPEELTFDDIAKAAQAIIEAPLRDTTRYRYIGGLRRVLRYLHENHNAPRLAAKTPRVATPVPRNVTATADERALVLNSAPRHMRVWLLLCSDLAIRSGTAARLLPENYNPETRELSFRTKFSAAQTLPVTQELAELFAQHKEPANIPAHSHS